MKTAEHSEAVGIPVDHGESSSDEYDGDSIDDITVDERCEVAVESFTSGDESSSDDDSDDGHPHEPGGDRGHSA